jgi:nicotinate-nucleotide pyrophosphorylase (carboxylating)
VSTSPRHHVPRAPEADALVAAALAEDLGSDARVIAGGSVVGPVLLGGDPTTAATVPPDTRFVGSIIAREPGVVAGLPYAARTWELLAELVGQARTVTFEPVVSDGWTVEAGDVLAMVGGPASLVLAGERTALDFLMVLSGIATEAARWQAGAGHAVRVTDTRKTVPGLRELSKYAVAAGGAANHRAGLWDMVLIKDNHLHHAGSVDEAVRAAREARPDLEVEVEVDTVDQAIEAAAAGADYVLLDNMDDVTLTLAVQAVRAACAPGSGCVTEASGGITFDRLQALAATGVDRVSTSKLTMAPPLDIALDAE